MKKIAIIGAGFSALTLASELCGAADLSIFEKARGVGGRMSTRSADPFQFDHGAQYFTARSRDFKNFLVPYIRSGIVRPWTPRVLTLAPGQKSYRRDWFEPHYVAAPKMTSLARAMAQDMDVHLEIEIESMKLVDQKWALKSKTGLIDDLYDWVISTAPAPQSAKLLGRGFSGYDAMQAVRMTGCYSLMLGFNEPLKLNWDAVVVKDSPIGWMSVQTARPGRECRYSLLVQSTNDWAEAHIDDSMDAAKQSLMKALGDVLPGHTIDPVHHDIHRWRYAAAAMPLDMDDHFLIDPALSLAACGDWCGEGRVESAFTSGLNLAEALKLHL